MKRRIVRRYSPGAGTWWIIQRKFLFWWISYDLCFKELKEAVSYALFAGLVSETYCETEEYFFVKEKGLFTKKEVVET